MGTEYIVTPWHWIVGFGSAAIMAYAVYWYIKKGSKASEDWNIEHNELKEALHAEEQELQKTNYAGVTFASVVGEYLVCPSCSFENFKNTRECTICKTRLIQQTKAAVVANQITLPAASIV